MKGAAERGAGALQPTVVGAYSVFASAANLDLLEEEVRQKLMFLIVFSEVAHEAIFAQSLAVAVRELPLLRSPIPGFHYK